jgi:hypothetical protein
MKIERMFGVFVFVLVALSCSLVRIHGQGFVNLNFESAVIVPIPGDPAGRVQFGPAFPGWNAYYNSSQFSSTDPVTYNNPTIGTAALGLFTPALAGSISNLTALLQGSTINGSPDVSLAQVGMVPSGTLSLRFAAYQAGANLFVVSMNGQPLQYRILQDFGTFREYGADISAYAGQTAELRFTQRSGFPFANNLSLDNIAFSPIGVPEPSTLALFVLGSALCWCAARRRRK